MTESQPGTVVAFNPSVSLSNFSAGTRDHLIFNENQLVLAQVQQTQPTSAYAYSVTTSGIFAFEEYKNTSGDFVYIDGSYQSLTTGGVPTKDVHRIVVGFDQQIATNTVVFWSTDYIDTGLIFMEYSFDNSAWFSVGAISWSYIFDDTIPINPSDSPPTGEYKYTGTFDGGSITARYWRIRSDAECEWLSGTGTILTVDSTDYFPATSSDVKLFRDSGVYETAFGYTGKTSTTFTGRNPAAFTDFEPEDKIINLDDPFGNGVTEIQIIPTSDPILQHWNSDGSQAVSVELEGSNYYHLAYDKTDDVYYAVRFDHNLEGSAPDPDDNFDSDTGVGFDPVLWIEDTTNVYFTHNTASGTLDYKSSGGPGQIETTYGLDGNFNAVVEFVALVELSSSDGFFGLESKGYDSGNEYIVSALKGSSDWWVGATVEYSDTVGGVAELQDFRVHPEDFDFSEVSGELVYHLLYDVVGGVYEVSIVGDGTPYLDASPGVEYTLNSSTSKVSFLISNLSTPADGTGFVVTVKFSRTAVLDPTTTSGHALEVMRTNTNAYSRYKEAGDALFSSIQVGNIPVEERQRIQLYANADDNDVDIGVDNFTVTGTLYYDSPVLSLVTLNKDGEMEQVSGVSDSDGYAIKRFDVIKDVLAEYNDYMTPKVGVATNAGSGSGGEIYIKVNDSLYKYLKSDLPLDLEAGEAASVTSTGEIPSTGVTNFAYNGYSGGGLSYIEYIADLSGVFVKTISTTSLVAQTKKAMLDVASINYPFTWNVSDLSTLYFVEGTALKLYDMNETKAAFVNVTSDKQVLAAGTAETATITAQVLNVYGEPKSIKSMTFSVSAGDGAVSPATGCSDVNGEDTTTYTVGSAVGTAVLTTTVSDNIC